MPISLLLFFSTLILSSTCQIGIFVLQQRYPSAVYQCIKQKGYYTSIIQLQSQQKGLNSSDLQNLINAKVSGFDTNVVFFPCRGNTAKTQAKKIIQQITPNLAEIVWIAPYPRLNQYCSWGSIDKVGNCEYIKQLLLDLRKNGIYTGVLVSILSWPYFYGTDCLGLDAYKLLWYQIDGVPSFDNYKQIGNWLYPSVKIYKQNISECGANLGLIYKH